ncbi:MAG: GpE family phage tail protein [Pseudomonadales bacterium]
MFHWSLSDMQDLGLAELMQWRERASERSEAAH